MTSTLSEAPVAASNGADSEVREPGGGGSVASESTQQTTQTRFSFYNAEDFSSKSSLLTEAEANAQRFSIYSASQDPTPLLGAGSSASNDDAAAETDGPSLSNSVDDPNEILKSLQAHEQQRREILQSPAQKARATNVDRASMHSHASESSNPYEDAIKDALDLLRRHRTGTAKSHPVIDTSEECLQGHDEHETSYTQEEVEALSRSLEKVNISIDEEVHASANGAIAASLGEAYQAEIEARRKQRQERMARYANRLAELKNEGGAPNHAKLQTLTPTVDTAKWNETPNTAQPATTRSAPMMNTSIRTGHTPSNVSGLDSEASSASPEEVQRGVERVLLAILERAGSQGRSVRSPSFGEGPEPSGEDEVVGEEKKCSTVELGETDEDLLVRAMSDLLGAPSTSSLGSSSPNRNAIQEWLAEAERQVIQNGSDEESNFTGPMQAGEEPSESQTEEGDLAQDELDEMVRKVLNKDRSITEDSGEDSFDRRVRSILSQEKVDKDEDEEGDVEESDVGEENLEEDEDDDVNTSRGPENSDDDYHLSNEEDETIRSNTYIEDESSENDAFVQNEDFTDDDSDAFAKNDDHPQGELDGVLGPLSKRGGGTTAVVLEDDDSDSGRITSPSILESLSAAMSLVTGSNKGNKMDKYAADYDDDDDLASDDEPRDDKAFELMRTLCAHLLPVGVNQSSKILDKRPAWDESNPDEAGYRIIRLSLPQLTSVERAFDRMVTGLKQNSEKKLSVAGTDEAFQRDLKAAEELLDESERRSMQDGKAVVSTKPPGQETVVDFEFSKEIGNGESLDDFPGVKPTGRGEMGDLEYFQLPIIFKSHVTGFEPTKDMCLEAGNIVAGQFLVEGELGSAAFSTAYRCVDLNSGDGDDDHEEVCLKVIKNTKDFFDQSLDEIKILELLRQTGKCREKYIVEMRSFFYHREHLIIVTELLRQNLFEFGKFIIDNDEEPYFTMSRLAFVSRQVLIALEFVHRLGLVHSDVKPENILLSSYSRAQVKLIDFGSSCYLTDRQSSYIQSRSYRAPEVVLGLPYDGRIDIWSLGCVVAEMFTGEVTFQNDSIVSMLSRIEAICGTFPRHMIAQGRQSGRFFAKSGLLFEKVVDEKEDSGSNESDDDDDSSEQRKQYVDIFQPKTTSLAARLGFAGDLMDRFDSGEKVTKEESRQAMFVDFVRKLLTIDPDVRPTARQALQHPWMLYAESLTEDDIRYPSA